jgi:hypothetical protein
MVLRIKEGSSTFRGSIELPYLRDMKPLGELLVKSFLQTISYHQTNRMLGVCWFFRLVKEIAANLTNVQSYLKAYKM